MSTRYVPAVVVLALDRYEQLVQHVAQIELPADIRQIMADNGWTHEAVMLGQCLVRFAIDNLEPKEPL